MTHLQVRRPRFDFTEHVPFVWNPQNPAFSFNMNATSLIIIGFEQLIVSAVQEARPLITDSGVADEAMAFLRQEAQHSSSHRKHVAALIKQYPGLQHTLDEMLASFDRLTATTPLAYRLAYIADLESTFTPAFKLMLDNEDTLFRPGDDRVASLFLWHFVEEVEHRSSALIIYDAVVGKRWYRLRVLPRVVKHLLEVMELIADGVNSHVPLADRHVDARTLLPSFTISQSLRGKSLDVPAPFAAVSLKEKMVAGTRVLLSQTPFHDPAHEPLPEFADRWFDRYASGGDVVRWYGSS